MNSRIKLTPEDVRLIRDCSKERARLLAQAAQFKPDALAEKFGVSKSAINNIRAGRSWAGVDA